MWQAASHPLIHIKRHTHRAGSSEEFILQGNAVSLKASGEGCIRFETGGRVTEEKFNTHWGIIRKFIEGEVKITLLGALSFEIFDLCSFSEARWTEESKIPVYYEEITYPLDALRPDILSPHGAPLDARGNEIEGARYSGRSLILPRSFEGEVTLHFKRAPAPVTAEAEIDIPEDCRHLLPLLTAAYLWLDDDGERSAYYMQLYREAMASLKRSQGAGCGGAFRDVLGWC